VKKKSSIKAKIEYETKRLTKRTEENAMAE
jgi:hypothetical protein